MAAKLKLFVTETRNTFIPSEATAALAVAGGRNGSRDQGTGYVFAPTKKVATELLQAARVSTTFGTIRVSDGSPFVSALERAGLLAESAVLFTPLQGGEVLSWNPQVGWVFAGKVAREGGVEEFVSFERIESLTWAMDKLRGKLDAGSYPELADALEIALYAMQLQLDATRRMMGIEG